MASSFVDSLKLVLSDSLEISDSGYKSLSDILVSQGLSDTAFDSGLIQMIHLMVKNHYRFPISITFLKELWETENTSFNFVKMVGDLLKNGSISLRKVKRETFYKDNSITKSDKEDKDKDLYVVIYGTKDFNKIFSEFERVFNNREVIQESFGSNVPKKINDILSRASSLLKNMDIGISLESYVEDSVLGVSRLNLIISRTSKYIYKDKDIQRVASRVIKGSSVQGVESYIESDSELFLGIDLYSKDVSYRDLSDKIYSFVEELEVKGV